MKRFFFTKVKNAVPWTYVISDPKGGEIVGMFYKKELQKNKSKRVKKKIKNIKDKMPDITSLATNTTLNAKINEVKNEIPSITNLLLLLMLLMLK